MPDSVTVIVAMLTLAGGVFVETITTGVIGTVGMMLRGVIVVVAV